MTFQEVNGISHKKTRFEFGFNHLLLRQFGDGHLITLGSSYVKWGVGWGKYPWRILEDCLNC